MPGKAAIPVQASRPFSPLIEPVEFGVFLNRTSRAAASAGPADISGFDCAYFLKIFTRSGLVHFVRVVNSVSILMGANNQANAVFTLIPAGCWRMTFAAWLELARRCDD